MVQKNYILRLAQHQHLLKMHHVVGQMHLWGGYFFVPVVPNINDGTPVLKAFRTILVKTANQHIPLNFKIKASLSKLTFVFLCRLKQ